MTDNPFPEARHFDDFTAAVRALNATNTVAEVQRGRDHRALMSAIEKLTIATEHIATHTENLPALVELLKAKTNGTSHHEETDDVRPDPR